MSGRGIRSVEQKGEHEQHPLYILDIYLSIYLYSGTHPRRDAQ